MNLNLLNPCAFLATRSAPPGIWLLIHPIAEAAFSLDQLLHVQLDAEFDKVRLEGWTKYYFYAHRLFGWALGSFLVAGLAGLTQKRQ
jgi:hypothetical protein